MVEYRQDNVIEVVFDGQDLTGSIFDRCNVKRCSFKNCTMTDVLFDRCNCIECNWEGVDMESINFVKTNIIEHEDDQFPHHELEAETEK